MSYPNILIIEPDLSFASKITQELQKFNFNTLLRTDIEEPDQLASMTVPIHTIVLNLELKSIEGLTLYSYIKNLNKFRNTTFTFITDNENTFCLLENMPLERSVVCRKGDDFQTLISNIINNMNYSLPPETDSRYITEASGELSKIPVEDLLLYCSNTHFSGNTILTHEDQFCIIEFKLGQIEVVHFQTFDTEEALSEIQNWSTGNFRLERKRPTTEEMEIIISNLKTVVTQELNTLVGMRDVLIDVFNYLHQFLSEQFAMEEVNRLFEQALQAFKERHPDFVDLDFYPASDDKISLKQELSTEMGIKLAGLFRTIFHQAEALQPEIEIGDFLDRIEELDPFLRKLGLYEALFEQKANIVPDEVFKLPDTSSSHQKEIMTH